jgi:hypothetical protein
MERGKVDEVQVSGQDISEILQAEGIPKVWVWAWFSVSSGPGDPTTCMFLSCTDGRQVDKKIGMMKR